MPNQITLDPEDAERQDQLLDPGYISFRVNLSIVNGTPRWSQRAYSAINEGINAVVYMLEAGALTRTVEYRENWRIAFMSSLAEHA